MVSGPHRAARSGRAGSRRGRRPARERGRDAAASPGPHPLIVYSHHSGGHRRTATFLCTHLASHGYVVAASDHSEVVAPELAPRGDQDGAELAARIDAIIASRVPDVRFLLGQLLDARPPSVAGIRLDPARVGLAGHSFGGWTALATPDEEPRVRAVVALAPGGGSEPKPGLLPLRLAFAWGRDLPTLYLAAGDDVLVPVGGVRELLRRTPAARRMFVLQRADHQHFVDDVAGEHEALRAMPLAGDAAWIPAAMRPVSELCPAGHAHAFARALALAHFDAALQGDEGAGTFLSRDVHAELAARGIDATE